MLMTHELAEVVDDPRAHAHNKVGLSGELPFYGLHGCLVGNDHALPGEDMTGGYKTAQTPVHLPSASGSATWWSSCSNVGALGLGWALRQPG